MIHRPAPFKENALRRLRGAGVPVTSVVDVGVREHTPELIKIFPDKHHLLFEPVSQFFSTIETNYKNVEKTLYPIALSDEDGEVFLVMTSLQTNGIVTHSYIRDQPDVVDGKRVVACDRVVVRRFDSLALDVPKDFLLKVDVDGKDLNVMRGFGAKIRDASAVVVEVTFNTLFERMELLVKAGFRVFDMVDLTYYGASLYQADLIMLRADLVTPEVLPPLAPFQSEAWRQFHAGLTRPESTAW